MNTKIGIYSVAVIAFKIRIDRRTDGEVREGSYVEQRPALIPAENIYAAAEEAKHFAFDLWPKEEGWYGHQAAIQPVTNYFMETGFEAFQAGIISLDTEEPQAFNF